MNPWIHLQIKYLINQFSVPSIPSRSRNPRASCPSSPRFARFIFDLWTSTRDLWSSKIFKVSITLSVVTVNNFEKKFFAIKIIPFSPTKWWASTMWSPSRAAALLMIRFDLWSSVIGRWYLNSINVLLTLMFDVWSFPYLNSNSKIVWSFFVSFFCCFQFSPFFATLMKLRDF